MDLVACNIKEELVLAVASLVSFAVYYQLLKLWDELLVDKPSVQGLK